MGGAQPLAGTMAKAAILCVEVDEARIDKRMAIGFLDTKTQIARRRAGDDPARRRRSKRAAVGRPRAATPPTSIPRSLARGIVPDIVTDQTSAHDLVYGYIPAGRSLDEVRADAQRAIRNGLMAEATRSIVRHVTRDARVPEARRGGVRQRQPDPHPGQERRRRRTPSTSRSSPRRSCGRCSRARSARSAGSRCPTIPTTSARSTTCCCERFGDNRIVIELDPARARSMCRSRVCRRGSPGSVTASAPSSALAVNAMVRDGTLVGADRLHPRPSRRRRDGASRTS